MDAGQYYANAKPDREQWRELQVTACMWCGIEPGFLEIHEICRRSRATRTWAQRTNYLLLCGECHGGLFASLGYVQQLAVKKIRDKKHFDLVAWRELSGYCVSELEVGDAVQRLRLPPLRPRSMPHF